MPALDVFKPLLDLHDPFSGAFVLFPPDLAQDALVEVARRCHARDASPWTPLVKTELAPPR
jgi:hypothetical protein